MVSNRTPTTHHFCNETVCHRNGWKLEKGKNARTYVRRTMTEIAAIRFDDRTVTTWYQYSFIHATQLEMINAPIVN